jgi:hypothetical protein
MKFSQDLWRGSAEARSGLGAVTLRNLDALQGKPDATSPIAPDDEDVSIQ